MYDKSQLLVLQVYIVKIIIITIIMVLWTFKSISCASQKLKMLLCSWLLSVLQPGAVCGPEPANFQQHSCPSFCLSGWL